MNNESNVQKPHGDAIDDVKRIKNTFSLHMWSKFGDDWSETATCIAGNVTISFKHEYWMHTLTSLCDVMNIKNSFYAIICDVLCISYVKINLSQIFRNFQNCRHFGVRARFKTGSCNGDMAISKFDLFCDLVTQLFDLWTTKTTWFCVLVDYICGQSLVMISQKLRPVSRKMWQYHLNMKIESQLWRHAVTSSTSKIIFGG